MKITEEIMKQGKSKYGSWSAKQLHLLGVEYPLVTGWYDRLIGADLPEENVKSFLDLKDAHITAKRERLRTKRQVGLQKKREKQKERESYAVADFFRVTEGL